MGNEGAGEVTALGDGVNELKLGDRVAYSIALGSYAASGCCRPSGLSSCHKSISYEQAAGMMLKGMTVQYLLRRTFKVGNGTTLLFHAAAGGSD